MLEVYIMLMPSMTQSGGTALHIAVSHNNDDIVELLVHYNADVGLRDNVCVVLTVIVFSY